MARLQVKGLDEYTKKIQKLYDDSEIILKRSIYPSAAFVIENMKKAINSLPIEEGPFGLPPYGTAEKPISGVSRKQKGDLMDGIGISDFQSASGYLHVKIGFDGYGSVKTKSYPKGLPNVLLARAVTTGSYFRKKNTSIRRAVTKSKKEAAEIMNDEMNKLIRRKMR